MLRDQHEQYACRYALVAYAMQVAAIEARCGALFMPRVTRLVAMSRRYDVALSAADYAL